MACFMCQGLHWGLLFGTEYNLHVKAQEIKAAFDALQQVIFSSSRGWTFCLKWITPQQLPISFICVLFIQKCVNAVARNTRWCKDRCFWLSTLFILIRHRKQSRTSSLLWATALVLFYFPCVPDTDIVWATGHTHTHTPRGTSSLINHWGTSSQTHQLGHFIPTDLDDTHI